MSLIGWLLAVVGTLVLIRLLRSSKRRSRVKALVALARSARMNFSPVDRFDLARRLQQSPSWTAGLTVRDVMYGVCGGERLFIVTLERIASQDDRCSRYVLACAETLDHTRFHEASRARRINSSAERIPAYEEALADFAATQ